MAIDPKKNSSADPIDELAARIVSDIGQTDPGQRRVLERLKSRLYVSRKSFEDFEDNLTFGQRLADRIAIFGGSWTFIILFMLLLVAWVVLNSYVLTNAGGAFDPYPYIFLNLVLSMIAALQAPVIMMSQNRHAAKDRAAAQHDYEVNLKAELEILALHQKIDALRDRQWQELVEMQRQQIELLTKLLEKHGAQ